MGMRRDARKHDTVAVRQSEAASSEDYAEHGQGDRVMTIDGPGRVIAVHDGPYPGSEEYEIRLEGGLGGGTYDAGQIMGAAPVQASVVHTADQDYPELGNILHDRPDPATMRYTAVLDEPGMGLTSGAPPAADGGLGDADDGQVMYDTGEYHSDPPGDHSLASRHAARAFDHYHPGQVYLRFGHWPENERSSNNVTGFPEEGVSVYDLDHEGEPMDPDPGWERGHHVHDEGCGEDCDIPEFDEDYGNDTGEEMRGRAGRAEKNRRYGRDLSSETGHLVKGDMVGIGHDGEPLLNNVRRVGDWIDHRHLFVPGASKHPLARDEDDEDYEPPEERPTQRTARSINGEEIDNHGTAPHWPRAGNPNRYDELSTEGEPDPDWIEDIDKRQQAMASLSSLPSVIAEVGPADLGRELDKFRDDQEERHQDDARFATNWEPLHKSDLPADEHGPWMFMENKSEPVLKGRPSPDNDQMVTLDGFGPQHMNLTTYKHGITRMPLHLDEQGRSWKPLGQVTQNGQTYQVMHRPTLGGTGWSAAKHLREAGHYDLLDKLGATPQTKYDTDYQMQRNKRLNDAGYTVVSHQVTAHDEHENLGPAPKDRDRLRQHLITDHGYTHDQLADLDDPGQGDALEAEHELDHDELHDNGVGGGEFGNGEGIGAPHVHKAHEPEQRGGYAPFPDLPQSYHPAWGGSYNPASSGEFVPAEADTEIPLHMLSSLVSLASADPEFRFHVTAAWRDVQTKAKRIRSEGGVQITHADDSLVIGNVRGDHNVYETGLQRVVGKRQSVASYSCGCKWGAYHWGASDDLSRFAGRMCSHALALQYEAASRGMFGRDVEVDSHRPKWVPSKVVVKYDIDEDRNIRARSSLTPPEQPALIVAALAVDDDDPRALAVLAAVNDLFGDTSGYSEPSLMSPMGPTVPWNPDESPASAGTLSGNEPDNWGRISGPTMLPHLGTVAGGEATLHEEPEGALPETDGEDHTASMGDVDLTGGSGIGGVAESLGMEDEDLSPENPSIQPQGSAGIVADFQRSAAARKLLDGGRPGDTSGSDIARAAQEHLAKVAANFTRAEQDALIHESPGTQASNTDRLSIEGTHYADLEAMGDDGDDDLWMM